VGTNLYGCKKRNLWFMRTNLWLWEQKPMVVGTKLFCREKKSMVGKTNHKLWEQIYGQDNKNVGNELITR
jgi:hypothetical protein